MEEEEEAKVEKPRWGWEWGRRREWKVRMSGDGPDEKDALWPEDMVFQMLENGAEERKVCGPRGR